MLGCLINPWAAVGAVAAIISGWLRSSGGVIALFEAEGNTTIPGFGRVVRLREVNFERALGRSVAYYSLQGIRVHTLVQVPV